MNKEPTKRALVLSGGGSRGAYQVGALKHLLRDLRIEYDIISGISVGALNGSFLSMFGKEDEVEASIALSELWKRVDDDLIYKKWWFRELAALWRPSIYNSKPLQNLVEDRLDSGRMRRSGKELSVGAVSLTTGEYRTWNQNSEDIKKAVMASSSFPGMFLPVEIEDQYWVDGGLREISPVNDAIALGATHIDVILTHPQVMRSYIGKKNVIKTFPRIFQTMLSETVSNDLQKVKLYNRLLKHEDIEDKCHIELNVLEPKQVLIDNPLDFDPDYIRANMSLGYRDAQQIDWQ